MKKEPIYIAVIGALVLAIGVLVLRREGEEVRQTIKQTAKEDIGTAVREGIENAGEKTGEKIFDVMIDEVHGVVDGIAGTDEEGEDSKTSKSRSTTKTDLPVLPKIEPKKAVAKVFEIGRDVVKTGDEIGQKVFELSLKEEIKIGLKLHEAILNHEKVLKDDQLQKRLEKIAEPFLAARSRKSIEYTFTILDKPDINAASIMGGFVYVNKGLIDFAESDHDLECVLGHEVAHVDLRHCVRKYTYAARAKEVGTIIAETAVALAYHLISTGYTKNNELDADVWCYRVMSNSGRKHEDCVSFLRRLRKHLLDMGIEVEENDEPENIFEVFKHEATSHFESHPPTKARIQRLEELVDRS